MTATAQKITPAEVLALEAWKAAYERTDLVARLGFATLSDYRHQGVPLNLDNVMESQLDRFEQAVELEQQAHAHLEQMRNVS